VIVSETYIVGAGTTVGMDDPSPTLAWRLTSSTPGDKQTAFELQVGTTLDGLDVFATGQQTGTAQEFKLTKALASATQYYWRVRVWDAASAASAWTRGTFDTGLWSVADWSGAKWIGKAGTPAPQLRKSFATTKTVAWARLYVGAGGYAEASVNGTRVSNALEPGFTNYVKRVQYVAHDVTSLLSGTSHALALTLGRGFYGCTTATDWGWNGTPWFGDPRAIIRLLIRYTDGTSESIISDETWKAAAGPTTADSVYLGDYYDARLETAGWKSAGFDDTAWTAAELPAAPKGALVAQMQTPIRAGADITPVSVVQRSANKWRYTFPDVHVGWVRLAATATSGDLFTVEYAENLNADGTLQITAGEITGTINTDKYTAAGGAFSWEPRFSYKSFTYVDVSGPVQPTSVIGVPVWTDYEETGSFTSSNSVLNQMHGMSRRSFRLNSHGIITDTPHTERNGWLGDANVMATSAIYSLDMHCLFKKWLTDMADDLDKDGLLGVIVPSSQRFMGGAKAPEWCAAFVLIAWKLYSWTGDISIISQQFEKMRSYVDYWLKDPAVNAWDSAFGDWSSPSGNYNDGGRDMVGTTFVIQSARRLADMADVLGKPEVAAPYRARVDTIISALNARNMNPTTGVYLPGPAYTGAMKQTPTVLALKHSYVPANLRASAAAALENDVRVTNSNHLTTGIIGEEHLLGVLCDEGYVDTAYAVASQTTYPAWGYWATLGATTTWNGWGSKASQRTLSHHMHGAYLSWLYQYLAGINITSRSTVTIKPYRPAGLTSVSASVKAPRGVVSVAWDATAITITIPPGMTGTYNNSTIQSGTTVINF